MFYFIIVLFFTGRIITQCPENYTGLYPYEESCYLFYNCWKGREVIQFCPPGTAFHTTNLECDHMHKVSECHLGKTETNKNNCTNMENTLQPIANDCSKFFRCSNGNQFIFDCPPGTKFDRKSLICDHAYKVDCNMNTDIELEVDESIIQCQGSYFMCDNTKCLNKEVICNDWKDCDDGIDEVNCNRFLEKFVEKTGLLQTAGILESWMNVNLFTCARLCLETAEFQCQGFNYKMINGICDLSDQFLHNTLVEADGFNFYERKQYGRWDQEIENFNIRLRGSTKMNEGRIEVKIKDQWGQVCDDQFDEIDGDVVCRQLGFKLGAAEIRPNSYFSSDLDASKIQFWMDNVACFGNETSLSQCPFSGWGVHDCEQQEIVGVVCYMNESYCSDDYWTCASTDECVLYNYVCDGIFDCYDKSDESSQLCNTTFDIRLSNGSNNYEGRVEVRHNGIWGTICDDNFDNYVAKVVCNSLGLKSVAEIKPSSYFGSGSGPIWLDQIVCDGTEKSLEKCLRGKWAVHNCDHSEDIGVICSNKSIRKETKNLTKLEKASKKIKCGVRSFMWHDEEGVKFRVVSSQKAKIGDYPWQASIRIKKLNASFHWCGGVIISNKYILTSAHCLQGYRKNAYIVRVGDYNSKIREKYELESYIEDFYVHEDFQPGKIKDNDIALIKLKKVLQFNDFVQPICLPNPNTIYVPYMNCTISGYGTMIDGVLASSIELRSAWIPILPEYVCKSQNVYGQLIGSGMFCAGFLEGGIDTCEGDSGGPLTCLLDGHFTLFGITSWGKNCGKHNQPGVYVKVSKYIKWIQDKINKKN